MNNTISNPDERSELDKAIEAAKESNSILLIHSTAFGDSVEENQAFGEAIHKAAQAGVEVTIVPINVNE